MKNEKEFRDAVYEKARLYEKKRKARQRRITESVALLALCVAIGLSARWLLPNMIAMDGEASITTEDKAGHNGTTSVEDGGNHAQESIGTETTGAPLETTTEAPMWTTTTGAPMWIETTCTSTTTVVASTSATPIETTARDACSPNSTEFLIESVETSGKTVHHVPCDLQFLLSDSLYLKPQFAVVKSTAALAAELDGYGDRLSEFDRREIENTYDDTFFEENILILVPQHMTHDGYTVLFQSGGATKIVPFGEELAFKPYTLQTYVIPQYHYDDWNVIRFSYQEIQP